MTRQNTYRVDDGMEIDWQSFPAIDGKTVERDRGSWQEWCERSYPTPIWAVDRESEYVNEKEPHWKLGIESLGRVEGVEMKAAGAVRSMVRYGEDHVSMRRTFLRACHGKSGECTERYACVVKWMVRCRSLRMCRTLDQIVQLTAQHVSIREPVCVKSTLLMDG